MGWSKPGAEVLEYLEIVEIPSCSKILMVPYLKFVNRNKLVT